MAEQEKEQENLIKPEDLPVLTYEQNQFVKLYAIENKTGVDAYREAYKSQGKTSTCAIEATRLLKNPKITLWIAYYRQVERLHIENEIKYTIDDAFKECDDLKVIAHPE